MQVQYFGTGSTKFSVMLPVLLRIIYPTNTTVCGKSNVCETNVSNITEVSLGDTVYGNNP